MVRVGDLAPQALVGGSRVVFELVSERTGKGQREQQQKEKEKEAGRRRRRNDQPTNLKLQSLVSADYPTPAVGDHN